MTAVFLTALLFWAGVFAVFLAADGRAPGELLRGRYEPPPNDWGTWQQAPPNTTGPRAALVREERYLLPGGRPSSGHLLHQVRYRDPLTRTIVCVEPERRVPRRRIRG